MPPDAGGDWAGRSRSVTYDSDGASAGHPERLEPAAPPLLGPAELPALFRGADAASVAGQRRHLRWTAVQLGLLVLAGSSGVLKLVFGGSSGFLRTILTNSVDWAGVISAVAFAAAAVVGGYLLRFRPDRDWFEGRSAAESTKTLAWRYAVGGDPFPRAKGPGPEADRLLVQILQEVLGDLDTASLAVLDDGGAEITPAMREIRASNLAIRREVYRRGRIDDQRHWYAQRARWNATHAQRWALVLVLMEVCAAGAAVLKASGVEAISLLTLAAVASVAVTSWTQAKQFQGLASAYSIAAHELSAIRLRVDLQHTEAEWAQFVSDAEGAISREHTLWAASRGHRSRGALEAKKP